MIARRSSKRRDWPRGLYEPRPGYFVFRTPDGKVFPIGRVTLAQAKDEAIAANAHLSASKPSLVARIAGADHTLAQLVERMPVPEKENTRTQYRWAYNKIKARLGPERLLHTLTVANGGVKTVADALQTIRENDGENAALVCRSRLVMLFRKAMQLGWMDSNPAEVTERPAPKVKRLRLTLDSFTAVYNQSTPGQQHNMRLALVTGADVSTLENMDAANVLDEGGRQFLLYQRGKTGIWIKVPLDLRMDAIDTSLGDLIGKRRKGQLVRHPGTKTEGRVLAARISEYFTEARRAAGIPDVDAEGKTAPAFHEIRSLSKRLYERQGGVDTKALLGHAADKTAELYADPRGIEPVEVRIPPK